MAQFSTVARAAIAAACLLALAACAGPLLEHDASQGPGSDSAAASAVRGRAATSQFQ